MRLSHDVAPPSFLLLLLSLGAMALGLVAAKRQIDAGQDVAGLVCIALALLLASPISWTHHWVWAVIALLVLVQRGARVAALLLGAVFAIGPMWFLPRGELLELTHDPWQAALGASYVAVGLALLVFLATARQRVTADRGAVCDDATGDYHTGGRTFGEGSRTHRR